MIDRALDIALKQTDPLRKAEARTRKGHRATAAAKQRRKKSGRRRTYYSVKTDDTLWSRSQGRCEFIDPESGRRCECRFGLEREHIIPVALGGTDEIENLMLLCRTHNDLMARKQFGNEKIDREVRAKR